MVTELRALKNVKLIKGEWNKSIKFCWFLILENDLMNIINFAPEDDVWKMRTKDFIYIGHNYVVYASKVKTSWNCSLVSSDTEDKSHLRDRYSLPASELYKDLSTKIRNNIFFIKLICQLLF